MPDWFSSSGQPDNSANAEDLRTEFAAVKTGFSDLMPNLDGSGNRVLWIKEDETAIEAPSLSQLSFLAKRIKARKEESTQRESEYSPDPQPDPELQISLFAGKTYEIIAVLLVNNISGSDRLSVRMDYTGTFSSFGAVVSDVGRFDMSSYGIPTNIPVNSGYVQAQNAVPPAVEQVIGTITTTTAGVLSLNWSARRIYLASTVEIQAGSIIRAKEIG